MPKDSQMFYKLFFGGLIVTYLNIVLFGLLFVPGIEFISSLAIAGFFMVFAFFPILFMSLIRAFLISKLQGLKFRALITFILSLLFGSPGAMIYIVVMVVAATMAFYSYRLEKQTEENA